MNHQSQHLYLEVLAVKLPDFSFSRHVVWEGGHLTLLSILLFRDQSCVGVDCNYFSNMFTVYLVIFSHLLGIIITNKYKYSKVGAVTNTK